MSKMCSIPSEALLLPLNRTILDFGFWIEYQEFWIKNLGFQIDK